MLILLEIHRVTARIALVFLITEPNLSKSQLPRGKLSLHSYNSPRLKLTDPSLVIKQNFKIEEASFEIKVLQKLNLAKHGETAATG